MRPHKYIRRAKGYCCLMCDGSYSGWKRKTKRASKRSDKQLASKILKQELRKDEIS